MKQHQLIIVAIFMLAAAAVWLGLRLQTARSSAIAAQSRYERCFDSLNEIEFLKKRNSRAVVVAPADFDPSSIVTKTATDSGVSTSSFYANQSSLRLLAGEEVREWKIDLPPTKVRLADAVRLTCGLAESEMAYQVKSILLKAPSKSPASEQWEATWDVAFLKANSKE